jgi:hypothetical protein
MGCSLPPARLNTSIHCYKETPQLMHGVDETNLAQIHSLGDDRKQQVTLSVLLRIAAQGEEQLDEFLHLRPEPTSISFLSWLSDQALSQDPGLEPLCEYLVLWREKKEEERMDELYSTTLESLLDGVSAEGEGQEALVRQDKEKLRMLLVNNPDILASAVAEKLTGEPVLSLGMFEDPVMELALQSSPFPASLSPEGVKRSHEAARDLSTDLSARRKRSVTSMIGRAKLTSEQYDTLLAGTAASRILTMILSLPNKEDMNACLPECFTPPSEDDAGLQAEGETEELWCTPAQLLSEIEAQIRSLNKTQEGSGSVPLISSPTKSTLTGSDRLSALSELRANILEQFIAH